VECVSPSIVLYTILWKCDIKKASAVHAMNSIGVATLRYSYVDILLVIPDSVLNT